MRSAYRRSQRGPRIVLPFGVAALLLALIIGIAVLTLRSEQQGSQPGSPGPTAAPEEPGPGIENPQEISDLLTKLVVAPEAPMTGYSRDQFPHWDTNIPAHGFGPEFAQYSKCTTREVMMLRDAEGAVRLDPKTCDLTVGKGGGWRDRYGVIDRKTGKLAPYKFITDPKGVDAEHIVPLAEAWRSGAAARDENTRRDIANDALNLVASDPSANRSKGDQDAANYLPPGKFRCAYVAHYIKVKVKYALTVDPAEQTALRAAVDDCARRGGF
ncbi:HNH endonuclease family protein [Nocardia sp. CDC159]|uniref:HNH endonuclease family protein n=1 Tax=Nocardia pulmonis TaxID=2951408 RepID=A0A9X2E7M4_9NOCA|nr:MULTISPECIES: HNH endonuclease family protein [Nocardia]MCM6775249.1 HNH endonuclease family protein [Nocardia pulmonis]MCM6788017.1 HNH endonuclease family protein [Nocardia sp. CDC159]